ncbi:hypothetical protein GCM10028795_14340 [Lysobacter olei]
MRQHQNFAKVQMAGIGGAAGVASGGLWAFAGGEGHLHPLHRQRHPERLANRHAMPRPLVGVSMQAMVHMEGAQSAFTHLGPRGQCMKQHCGVQPAAEADA